MAVLGHERQLSFFPSNGHDHDGENSTPVVILPGAIGLRHLDPALIDLILGGGMGGSDSVDDGFVPVPDLIIETNAIGAGASVTGTVDWTGLCVVRYMRIFMSAETECTLTFYHKPTYADEDREFRAYRCGNKFLWEGAWIHYDEEQSRRIYYKIENTGTTSARFQVVLKSGTLVANAYARFVESIQQMGSSTAGFIGNILLQAGNGINITPDPGSNSFKFDAVAPETITIDRYGLIPKKHVSYTSSTTTSASGTGLNSGGTTGGYVNFGSGLQWITADFGTIYNVGKITVVPYPDGRIWNDVRIDGSFDGINWITYLQGDDAVGTITGLTVNIPSGMLMRYVRFWSNGSSSNTSNHVSAIMIEAMTNKVGS